MFSSHEHREWRMKTSPDGGGAHCRPTRLREIDQVPKRRHRGFQHARVAKNSPDSTERLRGVPAALSSAERALTRAERVDRAISELGG